MEKPTKKLNPIDYPYHDKKLSNAHSYSDLKKFHNSKVLINNSIKTNLICLKKSQNKIFILLKKQHITKHFKEKNF